MDPSYYNRSLCSCNKGYYGHRGYCKPCMEGGSCKMETPTTNETRRSASANDFEVKMTIGKGYWPCCGDFDSVTKLVKCREEKKSVDKICNPLGDCQCWIQLINGRPKTSCNSSCVCRHGNTGRFCSRCVDGYYKKGSLCVPCSELGKNFPVILLLSFLACFDALFGAQ